VAKKIPKQHGVSQSKIRDMLGAPTEQVLNQWTGGTQYCLYCLNCLYCLYNPAAHPKAGPPNCGLGPEVNLFEAAASNAMVDV
jgi:hypothetical protein